MSNGSGPSKAARLASLLSFRTISGRLIIGLVALLAVASVAVSVVTDSSLNRSLMSSLNQELQSATGAWLQCARQASEDKPDSGNSGPADNEGPGQADNDQSDPNYSVCSQNDQAPGTFEVVLNGSSVTYKGLVSKSCHLSAAEMAMLATLPSARSISTTSAISAEANLPGPGPAPGPAQPAPTYIRTLDSLGDEFLLTKVAGPNGTDLITGLPLTTVDATLHHVEDTEHVVLAAVLLLALVLGTGICLLLA